ncbi:alpha/beta hydrolase-fold protein [uncultured Maribacter sp.]|uniref:alpha/beta hydrolase n=1 Tax=uncultured Maribacter sp. TaxID=431308 RepID=UPI00262EB2D9|nr:alpha/beta hydrolase-fold protein [uncultured Maribacter sp.]
MDMKTPASRICQQLIYVISFCLLCVSHIGIAQQNSTPLVDSLFSKVLNEHRNYRVILPIDYDTNSGKKHDVIYVLDGETVVNVVSPIHRIASDWGEVPRCIIVGVDNKFVDGVVMRNRDLLPTHVSSSPLSGGANNYLKFIKEELMPHIDKKYATSKRNTLFGHSHGGTFTIYSMLSEPNLFNAYIATDPSLWWDGGYVTKKLKESLPNKPNLNVKLFVSGRKGYPYKNMGIETMDAVLKTNAPKNLKWESVAYENETHISVLLKTVYDGLKFVY